MIYYPAIKKEEKGQAYRSKLDSWAGVAHSIGSRLPGHLEEWEEEEHVQDGTGDKANETIAMQVCRKKIKQITHHLTYSHLLTFLNHYGVLPSTHHPNIFFDVSPPSHC